MDIKQKIAVYLGLIALLVVLLAIWGVFAFSGKTDVGAFIAQLGGLVTIVISAIAAVGGFHSAQSGQSAASGIASTLASLMSNAPAAPAQASSVTITAPVVSMSGSIDQPIQPPQP